MAGPRFVHSDLRIPDISFSSSLTDLVIKLDHLREKVLRGSTHPLVFAQLKHIFHMMESIGSVRIEGNNTTIAEFIDTKLLQERGNIPDNIQEILNLEKAMSFIEENSDDIKFDKGFIMQLFRMVTDRVQMEESVMYIGGYRRTDVMIRGVDHVPPIARQVEGYMQELLEFINRPDSPKYDLIKTAIAHHRFVWVHPFSDGNGRTVRMLTYAMLVKYGFGGQERIVNPTAVFCADRKAYYRHLALADQGNDEGLLAWIMYVLEGLKIEIEKTYRLLDYEFLRKEILLPAISFSLERRLITPLEKEILKRAAELQVIRAADLKDLFPGKDNAIVSRQIKKLIEAKMLQPEQEGARKYVIRFNNGFLLRGIIKALGDKGFLAIKDEV